MADAVAQFGIEFTDESGPAIASFKGNAEDLRKELDAEQSALSAMQRSLKQLQGGTVVSVEQFRKLKQQIADQKTHVASLASRNIQLGVSFKASNVEQRNAVTGLESLKAGIAGADGPLGSISSKVLGLTSKLGRAGLVGVVVIAAAAVIALGVAIAAAAYAIGKFAVSNADAYRSESLMLQALTKIPDWWGRAAGKADQLMASTNIMAATYGLARSQVMGFTTQLYQQGYRGAVLQRALESTSIAVAAFGGDTEKANRYMAAMSWQFGYLGKGSAAFAARVKHDLGDLATRQALGLSKQMATLKQNLGALFQGVKIEGFLRGLNLVLSQFSETTISGQILKRLIENLFSPLGKAEGLGLIVKHMIQDMIYWVLLAQTKWLEFQIVIQKVQNAIEGLGPRGQIIMQALGGIGDALIAPFKWAAEQVAWILFTFPMAVIKIGPYLWQAAKIIWTNLKAIFTHGWDGIGGYILEGLANGIAEKSALVWNAAKGLATGLVKVIKTVLGIHSPSLVMRMQVGNQIPAGVAVGVRAGIPQVRAAVREMAAVPVAEGVAPQRQAAFSFGQPSAQAARGPVNVQVDIHVDGAKGDILGQIREGVAVVLQQALAQAGVT